MGLNLYVSDPRPFHTYHSHPHRKIKRIIFESSHRWDVVKGVELLTPRSNKLAAVQVDAVYMVTRLAVASSRLSTPRTFPPSRLQWIPIPSYPGGCPPPQDQCLICGPTSHARRQAQVHGCDRDHISLLVDMASLHTRRSWTSPPCPFPTYHDFLISQIPRPGRCLRFFAFRFRTTCDQRLPTPTPIRPAQDMVRFLWEHH